MSDFERTYALIKRALQDGAARKGVSQVHWDLSSSCEDPRFVLLGGHQRKGGIAHSGAEKAPRRTSWEPGENIPLWLEMHVRCRQCQSCRRYRAWVWRTRAEVELRSAVRSWFGTLTLEPQAHSYYTSLCRRKAKERAVDFDVLTEKEKFARLHDEIGKELTKYLKRVRKSSGAQIRYLLVAEAHKQKLAGLPHYHLLVHEVDQFQPVRWATLSEQWKLGFSRWKLVEADDKKPASYVTKYLSKSIAARVRASIDYGTPGGIA